MTVEFGLGASTWSRSASAFLYIPAHLTHRESVAAQGGAGVVDPVGGVGGTVFNVEGPEPAT
jgi:hypothetical protein